MTRRFSFLTFVWSVALGLALAGCAPAPEPDLAVTLQIPTAVSGGRPLLPTGTAPSSQAPPAATATWPAPAASPSPEAVSSTPAPSLPPTGTPVSTPVATPVTDPATLLLSSLPLPALSRDVLFLADNSVKLWAQDGRLETLLAGGPAAPGQEVAAGDVVQLATAGGQRVAVAARVTAVDQISETLSVTTDLIRLLPDGGEARTVAAGVVDLDQMRVSDDGTHLALTTQSGGQSRAGSAGPEPVAATVRVVSMGASVTELSFGCTQACGDLVWHPDNRNLVWRDGGGVWLHHLDSQQAQLLLANQEDAAGSLFYFPISWARNGRFLLLWRSTLAGGERVVLDLPTGQLLPVPDSFVYAAPHYAEVAWMQDDRLLVSRPAWDGQSFGPPRLEIWRVSPDAGGLVLEETERLSAIAGGITAPVHLADGRFGFAIYDQADSGGSGLFLLTGFGDRLERISPLWPAPSGAELEVTWLPDGAGAIVQHQGAGVFFAPAAGPALYQVQPALGHRPRAFHVLPPRPA